MKSLEGTRVDVDFFIAPVQGVLISHGQFYDVEITVEKSGTLIFGFCSEVHNVGYVCRRLCFHLFYLIYSRWLKTSLDQR